MNWIPQIFRRRKLYNELSEEIRLHIEERAEQLMGEGMSREEADQAARRRGIRAASPPAWTSRRKRRC